MNLDKIASDYRDNGFSLISGFCCEPGLDRIKSVARCFHCAWVQENRAFHDARAVNSAYLTSDKYLTDSERLVLFELIASKKLNKLVDALPFEVPAFMGTQLFFNPVNKRQRNYWHRDPQYHLSVDEQKQALAGPEVIHFRLALEDEPGIEVVPGSHKQWDTPEQLDIRLEQKGRKHSDDIPEGKKIVLKKGDLLVFSANMIHRGLYGLNRFAFDILVCESKPEFLEFVKPECLPKQPMFSSFENSTLFKNVITHKHVSQ
ncbi:phytanoyl-CoA dioxygenase family protein [Sessilibacter corallicola]|uniref:Phytanoyl-CoA dioxygenase n=1 Tax=Sessilibacter corallicola TaxID=2904075 RepID=A0ABQ0A4Y1_9GAMM